MEKKVIYNCDDFVRYLDYECHRSNRSNREFSLIVFNIKDSIDKKMIKRKTIKYLENKIRILDVIGDLSENSLGLVLPDTSYTDARQFLEKINSLLKKNSKFIETTNVFTYPDKWNH
ncbi:MAG: hypothetical protein MJB14_17130 [Spirochaetes bacterium]|nr:hypothetical protein [Spirochaetota bacterium]